MWAGSLCAEGCFRDFSRPAGAADSLGLLKNGRALQSPRGGAERKGRRDLILSSWGEVGLISFPGLPLHAELVPHRRAGSPSASSLVSVSALPCCNKAWAWCTPDMQGRRGLFPLLPGQTVGKEGEKELALKELREKVGREREGSLSQTQPLSRASRGKHWEQLATDLETGPPKQKGGEGEITEIPCCQPARKKY